MPDYNILPTLIENLYCQTIEIDEYKSNGWFVPYYGIYRPSNMSLDSFLSLFKKISNDYPESSLRILICNNYCKFTNEDLENVDRKNLRILIGFSDFMDMKEQYETLN